MIWPSVTSWNPCANSWTEPAAVLFGYGLHQLIQWHLENQQLYTRLCDAPRPLLLLAFEYTCRTDPSCQILEKKSNHIRISPTDLLKIIYCQCTPHLSKRCQEEQRNRRAPHSFRIAMMIAMPTPENLSSSKGAASSSRLSSSMRNLSQNFFKNLGLSRSKYNKALVPVLIPWKHPDPTVISNGPPCYFVFFVCCLCRQGLDSCMRYTLSPHHQLVVLRRHLP